MQNTDLPPHDDFYSKFVSCKSLENEYTKYVDLIQSRLTTEQAVIKMKLSIPTPTVVKNYQFLQQIRKREQMSSFTNFFALV